MPGPFAIPSPGVSLKAWMKLPTRPAWALRLVDPKVPSNLKFRH